MLPNQQQLAELQAFNEPYCLTLYIPLSDSEAGIDANRIELKNLLREAELTLTAAGMEPKTIKKTLRAARLLDDDHELSHLQHGSLVLFVHAKLLRYYHLPEQHSIARLRLGTGFELEPLLAAIHDNKSYLVLALSHKHVRLYEGDEFQLETVHLKDFPSDMKQALNIDEYPNWRETHNIAPASSGKGSEGSHGQYNVRQTDKIMLLHFFRLIDKRLHDYLQTKQLPLLLAGVDYLLPIYRQVNTSEYLQPGNIKGNIEYTKPDAIRSKAWRLLAQPL